MDENFLNLERKMDIQIHEAQKTPNLLNLRKTIPRYIINKFANMKHKERILKATREKKNLYKGIPSSPHKTISGFLTSYLSGQEGME